MAQLGKILAKLRQERRLTKEQLGQVLCVSAGTISNYEKDVHLPDADKLIMLADYFHVSTDYLLGRTVPFIDFLHPCAQTVILAAPAEKPMPRIGTAIAAGKLMANRPPRWFRRTGGCSPWPQLVKDRDCSHLRHRCGMGQVAVFISSDHVCFPLSKRKKGRILPLAKYGPHLV